MINKYTKVELGGIVLPMCLVDIKNTPIYTEYENIFYSNVNLLRGWKVSCDVTAHYIVSSANKTLYDNVLGVVRAISAGTSKELKCFEGTTLRCIIPLDKLDSEISLNDYIKDNARLGFIVKIKFSSKNLLVNPILWDNTVYQWTLSSDTLIDTFYA